MKVVFRHPNYLRKRHPNNFDYILRINYNKDVKSSIPAIKKRCPCVKNVAKVPQKKHSTLHLTEIKKERK